MKFLSLRRVTLADDRIGTMKVALAVIVILLACQLERATPVARAKQAPSPIRRLEYSPCRITDLEDRQSAPCRSSRDQPAHGIACENDDDVTGPIFRLMLAQRHGNVDGLSCARPLPGRESAPASRHMHLGATLRC
jgi:hypothetical protein